MIDYVIDVIGWIFNVEVLNLVVVGIEYDCYGIVVDENFQISFVGVYVVGDVVNWLWFKLILVVEC